MSYMSGASTDNRLPVRPRGVRKVCATTKDLSHVSHADSQQDQFV